MRIVIAGGGLVGLTLASLLRERGRDAVVIERMPAGAYVRRGFMLGHQAYDAMSELGLMDEIVAAGRPIGTARDGGSAATAIEVGKVLAAVGRGLEVTHEHTVAGLLRAGGGRVIGLRAEGPDGAAEIPCDLVVACDGIGSRVREMAGIPADVAPMAEGKIEWMSPVQTAESFAMAYLSDGGHIGLLSWPEGSFGWRTTDRVGAEAALAPPLEALVESWSALLPQAADGVRGLGSMDEVRYSEPALLACPRWWVPGVVVIGDAAHFFGPETGASAGIGVADAHALAQAVAASGDDPDAACATYEAWRAPLARSYEAADPGRARLLGATFPAQRAEERWPPPGSAPDGAG
jgi:2-polyprenyl-6-methoxyphenol hydroxylase-like FAD-dependent oxidoreductase